jgi:hypothetical protein
MQSLNICGVFTAHLTDNIGGYGPSKVVSGGSILGYVPSIEVRFARVNKDSEVEKSAKGSQLIKTRAEIIKSRLGTYGKRVSFDLDMKHGLDAYAGLVDILKDYEFVIPASADFDKQVEEKSIPKRSSGWWAFKPWDSRGKKLFDYMREKELAPSGKFREKDFGKFVKDDPVFFDMIADLLVVIEKEEDEEIESNETTTTDAITETTDSKKTKKSSSSKKSGGVSINEIQEETESSDKGSSVTVTELT